MSLVHWWPLADLKDQITNISLSRYWGESIIRNGKLGSAQPFIGRSNSRLETPYQKTLSNQEFSIALWLRLHNETQNDTNGQIFTIGNWGTAWTVQRATIFIKNNNKLYFTISNGTNSIEESGPHSEALVLGRWYHVTAIVKNNIAYLYIDGELVSSCPLSYLPNFDSASNVYIGGNSTAVGKYDISDVRVYNHALSQTEVKELNKALVIHYSFNDILAEPTTNVSTINNWHSYTSYFVISERTETGLKVYRPTNSTSTVLALYNNAVTGKMAAGEIWTFSCFLYVNGQPYKCTQADMSSYKYSGISYYARDDGYYTCTFKVEAPETWVIHTHMFGSVGTNIMCEIDKIQFEKNDHATPYTPTNRKGMLVNEAGYVNPSSAANFKLSTVSNNGSYSGYFNGQTSYIDTPVIKPNMFSDDYTLSFWVYPLDNGRGVFFGDYQLSNGTKINFERQANGCFRYWWYTTQANDYQIDELTTPINQWTLLTITYSNNTLKFYKNGEHKKDQAHDASVITKTTNSIMRIGCDNRTGGAAEDAENTPFYGYLNDFRFYVTALSDQEIRELYNCGGRISNCGDVLTSSFIEDATTIKINKNHTIDTNEIIEQDEAKASFKKDGTIIAHQIIEI